MRQFFVATRGKKKRLAGKNFAAGGHFCNISCHMAYIILATKLSKYRPYMGHIDRNKRFLGFLVQHY